MSTVYTTGVFYFILMYMGSNVLPIGKFLHMSHMQQSFRAEEVSDTYYSSLTIQICVVFKFSFHYEPRFLELLYPWISLALYCYIK